MALYAPAIYAKAQSKLLSNFNAPEKRFRVPEVHNLFLRNQAIMMPDYDPLKPSVDRVVETNYFLRTTRALGSAIAHNHTGAQGDSGTLTPTWTAYTDKFASTLKEANNKIYSLEELHADKMQNSVANFAEGLDTVAAAALFANRSGVNAATADGTFNATDDAFEITETTNGNRAVQITKMVMDVNKYQGGNYTVVCDSVAFAKFEFDANQGTGNSVNTSFQFGGVTFIHDPSLTAAAAGLVAAYSKGFWIVVPDGTIAGLPWIETQNRQGIDTTVNSYGSIMNPVDTLQYGIHSYETRSDGTSLGGKLQDVTIETELHIYLAYEFAPISVATETAQFAFALV